MAQLVKTLVGRPKQVATVKGLKRYLDVDQPSKSIVYSFLIRCSNGDAIPLEVMPWGSEKSR
jgi:hypothetical protein